MRRLLLGTVAALSLGAFATASHAADLMDYPVGHDWAGWYAGVTAGYGFGTSRQTDTNGTTTGDYDIDGVMVGGIVGYNFVGNGFLYGVEGDFSIADVSGSTTVLCPSCVTDFNWVSTVRARIGLPTERALFYVAGGLAMADVDTITANLPDSDFAVGWTAGAGIEYALSDGVSLRAEYMYMDLGSSTTNTLAIPVSIDLDELHVVRGGVTFKF